MSLERLEPGDRLRWRVGRHKGDGELVVERVRATTVTLRGLGPRNRHARGRITLTIDEVAARCELVERR